MKQKEKKSLLRLKVVLKSQYTKVVAAFIVGAATASLFWIYYNSGILYKISAEIRPVRQNNNPYKFIDPLLGYDIPGNIKEIDEYKSLEKAVNSTIEQSTASGAVGQVSVYFRDLNKGRWMGINENTGYAPASMMKVAIMIAYFKESESNPAVLRQPISYLTSTANEIQEVPFETPSTLQVGKKYSVEQLIESMIETSDNGAKNVLLDNININSLNEIYTDLGLPNPDFGTTDYMISPKQYSVLLRILYNATYLTREDSEKALQIMSQAQFNQGLIAGVPSNTIVAQKFGEALIQPIILKPKFPYQIVA